MTQSIYAHCNIWRGRLLFSRNCDVICENYKASSHFSFGQNTADVNFEFESSSHLIISNGTKAINECPSFCIYFNSW